MLSLAKAQFPVSQLRVIESDEGHVTLSYKNVIIVLWYCSPRAETLHQLYRLAQQLTAEFNVPKVSVISVIRRKVHGAPSPAARAALAMLYSDPNNVLYRSALVFVNEGFVAASIRSLLLSVRNKLAGSPSNDIFRHLDEAIRWATEGLLSIDKQAVPVGSLLSEVNRFLASSERESQAS